MADDSRQKGIGLIAEAMAQRDAKKEDPLDKAFASLADLLAKLPAPIQNRWYHGQRINVDGYRFVRCRFDSCEIHTLSGTFNFDHCFFAGCTFYFHGTALKVVRLYNTFATEAWEKWPDLTPTVNSDGTVSILG